MKTADASVIVSLTIHSYILRTAIWRAMTNALDRHIDLCGTGDTHSDFADLNQQFRAGLNLVMSGIPYCEQLFTLTLALPELIALLV